LSTLLTNLARLLPPDKQQCDLISMGYTGHEKGLLNNALRKAHQRMTIGSSNAKECDCFEAEKARRQIRETRVFETCCRSLISGTAP